MNVLYHHRTQGVGAEGVHIRGVVDALRRRNCNVFLVSPPGVDPYRKKRKEIAKDKNGLLSNLAEKMPQILFEVMELFYNFYSIFALSKIVKKKKIDLIYERYAFYNIAGVVVSRLFNIPIILEANSSAFMKSHSRAMKLKYFIIWVEKKIFCKAKWIITISNNLRKIILDNHDVSEDRIIVMSNAIDPERFKISKNMERASIREVYSIKESFVVGFVGAFVKWHGIEFMLRSLHRIVKEKSIHILIVGDGPIRNKIEKIIVDLNIEKYVTITGFVEANEVPIFISAMDVCVMPDSNNHGSPVKIFEYMAMGKPVVAPVYGPIAEVLCSGEDSMLFEPRDSKAFTDIVCGLIDNRNFRSQLGKKAKEKVYQKYTWDNHSEKIILLFDEVAVLR